MLQYFEMKLFVSGYTILNSLTAIQKWIGYALFSCGLTASSSFTIGPKEEEAVKPQENNA